MDASRVENAGAARDAVHRITPDDEDGHKIKRVAWAQGPAFAKARIKMRFGYRRMLERRSSRGVGEEEGSGGQTCGGGGERSTEPSR